MKKFLLGFILLGVLSIQSGPIGDFFSRKSNSTASKVSNNSVPGEAMQVGKRNWNPFKRASNVESSAIERGVQQSGIKKLGSKLVKLNDKYNPLSKSNRDARNLPLKVKQSNKINKLKERIEVIKNEESRAGMNRSIEYRDPWYEVKGVKTPNALKDINYFSDQVKVLEKQNATDSIQKIIPSNLAKIDKALKAFEPQKPGLLTRAYNTTARALDFKQKRIEKQNALRYSEKADPSQDFSTLHASQLKQVIADVDKQLIAAVDDPVRTQRLHNTKKKLETDLRNLTDARITRLLESHNKEVDFGKSFVDSNNISRSSSPTPSKADSGVGLL